jgi:hypothetical protein
VTFHTEYCFRRIRFFTSIAKKYAQKRIESGDVADAWYPQLHSLFSRLEGSPDLARK